MTRHPGPVEKILSITIMFNICFLWPFLLFTNKNKNHELVSSQVLVEYLLTGVDLEDIKSIGLVVCQGHLQ